MALLFKTDDERARQWQALFDQHAPDLDVRFWPEIGDARDIRYFAVWQPPADLATRFPNLSVVFATSAGVESVRAGPATRACWLERREVLHQNRGGGVTPAVLPHHRTSGSVYGGSCLP